MLVIGINDLNESLFNGRQDYVARAEHGQVQMSFFGVKLFSRRCVSNNLREAVNYLMVITSCEKCDQETKWLTQPKQKSKALFESLP